MQMNVTQFVATREIVLPRATIPRGGVVAEIRVPECFDDTRQALAAIANGFALDRVSHDADEAARAEGR